MHTWLRRYAAEELPGLADRSSRPGSCPHQMPAAVEARVVEMRRQHPGWGPRTILSRLVRAGVSALPSRSAIYRALVRHQLIDLQARRRRPSDYKRWERSRAMELWQMDVTLGVRLQDGSSPSIVTGIDDHSRYCVSAQVVERATARPVCDALLEAMRRHGVPESILSDNGKVFTGRLMGNRLRGHLNSSWSASARYSGHVRSCCATATNWVGAAGAPDVNDMTLVQR